MVWILILFKLILEICEIRVQMKNFKNRIHSENKYTNNTISKETAYEACGCDQDVYH